MVCRVVPCKPNIEDQVSNVCKRKDFPKGKEVLKQTRERETSRRNLEVFLASKKKQKFISATLDRYENEVKQERAQGGCLGTESRRKT